VKRYTLIVKQTQKGRIVMAFDDKNDEIDERNHTGKKNEPIPKTEISNIVCNVLSAKCIVNGVILCLLMPLFAKLYQTFEFKTSGQCLTDSSYYIFHFPILGILLIALMFLIIGIGGMIYYFILRKK
jgi:4-hydroxybenzoate polyprenyltransferase